MQPFLPRETDARTTTVPRLRPRRGTVRRCRVVRKRLVRADLRRAEGCHSDSCSLQRVRAFDGSLLRLELSDEFGGVGVAELVVRDGRESGGGNGRSAHHSQGGEEEGEEVFGEHRERGGDGEVA